MVTRIVRVMALLIIIALLLTACQPADLTETDCPRAEVLCVGLVTDLGGINDKSFNQEAWEGVLKAETEKVVDWVRYIETIDSKDFDRNIAAFTGAGYDLIVTVGADLAESTRAAARNFPDIYFIGVDQHQEDAAPNRVGLVFHEDETGFLAGALAAQMTRTNTIAVVLGSDSLPSVVAFKEGFESGANYLNPNITIISTSYPGDPELAFTDPRWGSTSATQAIQKGADVITGAGGRAGNGALMETAKHSGLYCIGVDIDQWEAVSDAHPCLISSAMMMVTPGVFDLIKLTRDGSFPSGDYFGAAGLASYHDFDSVIPQAVKDKINQITSGLEGGSITTGYYPGG